ncbi:MAG: M12 family metallo-peptidase [Blastocatellia bacterium]
MGGHKLSAKELRRAKNFTKKQAAASTPALPQDFAETEITVLVVYILRARVHVGSKKLIEDRIRIAEEQTNQTFQNSQIPLYIKVVRMEETSFPETGSFNTDLDILALKTGGQQVRKWRDESKADLVGLIANRGDYEGLAFSLHPRWELNPPPDPLDPSQFEYWSARGFFEIIDTCISEGYYCFVHELDHNLGAGHDVEKYLRLYPDSHGWYFDPPNDDPDEGEVGTMMSYRAADHRKFYFSNPLVSYAGERTGDSTHNNARAIVAAMSMVSRYR